MDKKPFKVIIKKDTSSNKKKMVAEFFNKENKKIKTVRFGSSEGKSFIDHKDEKKKKAWLARHSVTGDWSNPMTASTLARYVLWSEPSIQGGIKVFKSRFNLK